MLGVVSVLLAVSASLAAPSHRNEKPHSLWGIATAIDKTELKKPFELRFGEHNMVDKEVKVGEKMELRCDVMGTPIATVKWYFNNKLVQSHHEPNLYEKASNIGKKTVQNGITAGVYVVPCVDKQHEGNYSCVVSNGVDVLKKSITVTVADGSSTECEDEKAQLPQIIMWSDVRLENQGNAVQLLCRSKYGKNVVWYGPEHERLNDSPNFHVMPNGDLVIVNVQWEHMGPYTCVVSNAFGEDRRDTFIYPTALEMAPIKDEISDD